MEKKPLSEMEILKIKRKIMRKATLFAFFIVSLTLCVIVTIMKIYLKFN